MAMTLMMVVLAAAGFGLGHSLGRSGREAKSGGGCGGNCSCAHHGFGEKKTGF